MEDTEEQKNLEETFSSKAFPTRSGSYLAYSVEYRKGDDKWRQLPVIKNAKLEGGAPAGVPSAIDAYPVNHLFGLKSWNEAVALAFWFMADCESKCEFGIELRIIPHRVNYDVKIYKGNEPISMSIIESGLMARQAMRSAKNND